MKATLKVIIATPEGEVLEEFQIRAVNSPITPEGFERTAALHLANGIRECLEHQFEVADPGGLFAEDEEAEADEAAHESRQMGSKGP